MDIGKINLIFNTLKYLRFKQVYYRIFYFVKNKLFNPKYNKVLSQQPPQIIWKDMIYSQKSFLGLNSFVFLNHKKIFLTGINWNFSEYGKLWTFNLNYFDFINQENIAVEDGIILIKDYIAYEDLLKDGKESYTISLRGINWVKFLSKNNIQDQAINRSLYNDYQRLLNNLEIHFLGNHYLENGFSLLFGAYYFQNNELYKKSKKILIEELNEQILCDGAHFELSPMYHQTLLYRVLDCISLIKINKWINDELEVFLINKAIMMLSWLQKITYKNGNIPMVNDSSYDIAPQSEVLFNYAKFLNLSWEETVLKDSGYRMIRNNNYELFIDVGQIGASYQPAHVHSDIFNFELYIDGEPVIVDTGTSTYEKNNLRQLQRSTESHNTVKIANLNQSQVWSGFRVGERAKIISLIEHENAIEATHDGYKKINILHTRKFISNHKEIIIEDILSEDSKAKAKAFLHFYPGINISLQKNTIKLTNRNATINFSNDVNEIKILKYHYALGFNKTASAEMIEISFNKTLKTQINL